ncbi:MAG: FCD domain-containing protein [Pseudomonadota bacterium]
MSETELGPTAASQGGGRAADGIIAQLEVMIVSGELVDGSTLPPERELMARFGASRTVVREALTTLTSRGFLEHRPRFRPIVRKPTYDIVLQGVDGMVRHLMASRSSVRNLYEMRLFVEKGLVRETALHARRDDIRALRAALVANETAIDDSEAFYRTDVAFHAVLYRVPRNPIFPAIHDAYTSWLAPHWGRMLRSPERNAANYRQHQAILAAVLDRDPDGAEEAMTRHLEAAWELVRVTFDGEQT